MRNFLMLLLAAPFLLSASVPEEYLADLQAMQKFFDNEELSMQLTYQVYAQKDNQLLDSKTGFFEKSPQGYYYSLEGITVIQNNTWNLYLSDLDQLMAVKESTIGSEKALMSFEEATQGCEVLTRMQVDNNYVYTITFKKPVSTIYSQVKIYARKSNLNPVKIVFDYAQETVQTDKSGTLIKDQLRLEVLYSDIKTACDRSFSTDDYFLLQGELLKPTAKYGSYQLIDQRKQNLK